MPGWQYRGPRPWWNGWWKLGLHLLHTRCPALSSTGSSGKGKTAVTFAPQQIRDLRKDFSPAVRGLLGKRYYNTVG